MVYVMKKAKKNSYESLVLQHTTTVELYGFMVSTMLVIFFCGQYADWSNLYVLLLEIKKTINILRVRLIRTWNASRIIACGFFLIKSTIRKFLYFEWKKKLEISSMTHHSVTISLVPPEYLYLEYYDRMTNVYWYFADSTFF